MIGPSTMLSAAHCYHTSVGWKNTDIDYYFGADLQDGTDDELDSSDYLFTTKCSWVHIPSGYANGDTSETNDFAVVEFDGSHCSNHPGYSTGWLGTWAASDSQVTDQYMYVYGYPGLDAECPGNDCFWPSIWGIGNNRSKDRYSAELRYKTDTSRGQSGAGVYRFSNGDRYIVGIHSSGGTNWNSGRRITSWLIGWVEERSDFTPENSSWSLPSQ